MEHHKTVVKEETKEQLEKRFRNSTRTASFK